MNEPTTRYRYEPAGFSMTRTTLSPLKPLIDAYASVIDAEALRSLIDPHLEVAIDYASPGLSSWYRSASPKQLDIAESGKARSLLRYIIRSRSRPTPFGLFAATSAGPLADPEHAVDSDTVDPAAVIVHSRPDMALIDSLHRKEVLALPPDALVRSNALRRVAHGRVTLPAPFAMGATDAGVDLSIKAAPAALLALERAADGITLDGLRTELRDHYEGRASTAVLDALLTNLVKLGFMIPNDTPSLVYAGYRPDRFLRGLPDRTSDMLRQLVWTARAESVDEIGQHLERATLLFPSESNRAPIDLHLTTPTHHLPLSRGTADRIADAATFMQAVAPASGEGDIANEYPLRAYHAQFLDRYGFGGAVRIADLVDGHVGLGSVDEYIASPLEVPSQPGRLTAYESVLSDVLMRGLQEGALIVEITEALEERMRVAVGSQGAARTPVHAIDVFAQVGRHHEGDGEDLIVLNSASVAEGGSTFGRFAHVLTHEVRDSLRALAMTPSPEAAVPTQMVDFPQAARGANVSVTPSLTDTRIVVNGGQTDAEGLSLDISDVHVTSDYDRLLLWSRTLGREITIRRSHVLNPELSNPVARLLTVLSDHSRRPLGGFSWGTFEGSLRLPRVVRRGVVLRAGEWTLPKADIDTTDAKVARELVDAWRQTWQVPDLVYEVEEDNRLLLNLDNDFAVIHILGELRTRKHLRFQEVLPSPDQLRSANTVGEGLVTEVVVPIALAEVPGGGDRGAHASLDHHASPSWSAVHEPHFIDDPLQVDDEWLSLQVYEPAAQHRRTLLELDEVLGQLLRGSPQSRWYFVQYQDPRPHLRIRVHVGEDRAALTQALRAWWEPRRPRGSSETCSRCHTARRGVGTAVRRCSRASRRSSRRKPRRTWQRSGRSRSSTIWRSRSQCSMPTHARCSTPWRSGSRSSGTATSARKGIPSPPDTYARTGPCCTRSSPARREPITIRPPSVRDSVTWPRRASGRSVRCCAPSGIWAGTTWPTRIAKASSAASGT
ncbi:hypothetical protein B5P19_15205 [Clavibacter sepedonicus]|nr:lantibiotic dehydratase [Clavibacter sepedonicus]OQJ45214.1 hypothetical protein B5P19_15205 [Clavibacter sepedonicus]OQJ50849.1 hypothetical protein B5P20_15540 [Clavibacter sepedonicus]